MIESLNPLFYYYNEEEDRVNKNNSNLYSPKTGFYKGNLFENEYSQYKNYIPKEKTPINEREALLYEIMAYDHASHDLELYLDVYPSNKEYVDLYEKYISKLNELKEKYTKKYDPICASKGTYEDGYFNYVTTPSAWLGI